MMDNSAERGWDALWQAFQAGYAHATGRVDEERVHEYFEQWMATDGQPELQKVVG